jgi:hypothetical protein
MNVIETRLIQRGIDGGRRISIEDDQRGIIITMHNGSKAQGPTHTISEE